MCWQNHPAVLPEIDPPGTGPRGTYPGDIREQDGTLTDRSPIWDEPRPRPWPYEIN